MFIPSDFMLVTSYSFFIFRKVSIVSKLHVSYSRSEYQGNVGCVLDTVLTREETISSAAAETPDTAFYQWVPFTLLFQVSWYFFPTLSIIFKSFSAL